MNYLKYNLNIIYSLAFKSSYLFSLRSLFILSSEALPVLVEVHFCLFISSFIFSSIPVKDITVRN